MKEKLETIIGGLTGDYAADLNKISDAIERAMDEGDQEQVMVLIEYGKNLMKDHAGGSEDKEDLDYRSQDYDWGLNKKTLPLFYEQVRKAMEYVEKNDLDQAVQALITAKQWLIPEEELRGNTDLYSFQSIFDEAIFSKLCWKEGNQMVVPEEQMFYSLYGSLLFESGKLEEAHRALELSVKLNPVESMSYLTLSQIEKIRGRMSGAEQYNRKALKYAYITEDIALALLNEGQFAQLEEEPNIAYRFYELALDFDPTNPSLHHLIEDLYEEHPDVGRGTEAEFNAYLKEKGIEIPPGDEVVDLLDEMMNHFEDEENWELAATACSLLEALPIKRASDYHHKLHDLMDRMDSGDIE